MNENLRVSLNPNTFHFHSDLFSAVQLMSTGGLQVINYTKRN